MNEQKPAEPTPTPQDQSFYGKQKWVRWGLIYLAIAAIIYTGIYYLFLKKQSNEMEVLVVNNQENDSPDENMPSNAEFPFGWKTYTNTTYGFSVKYPPDVVIEEENENQHVKFKTDTDAMYIYFYSPNKKPSLSFNLESKPPTTNKVADKTVPQLEAKDGTLVWVGPLENRNVEYLFIYTGGIVPPSYTNFYLLLSTFRFLDQTLTPTSSQNQVLCTQDVKLCPDGSYVGRRPPTCEFAPCP